ncbi:MAG: glycosyltransferase family 39 protein [Dehalococcoidia bacterium]|nr:glycosyltransferase family 39 protein [Dehalococcoidia bacterium]
MAVRLYGLTYGLPYLYNADETQIIFRALGMGAGDLNPHFFHWPASPLMYAAFALFGAYYVAGTALGAFHSVQDFAQHVVADPSALVILTRGLVAMAGTASVYLNYWIARRFFGSHGVGLAAALFLAVAPLHVAWSKSALADVPMVLGVQLFLLACHLTWERGQLRYYLLAGVFLGLATSLKYSGAIASPALLAAHWARSKGKFPWRSLLHPWIGLAAVAAVLAFVVATPFSVLSFPEFKRDLSYITSYVYTGQPWAAPPVAVGLYVLTDALPQALGLTLTVVSLVGVAYALYRRSAADIVLLAGLLPVCLSIALARTLLLQYVLPLLPFLTIFAARATADVLSKLRLTRSLRYAVVGAGIVALVAQPLVQVARSDYSLTRTDTRTEAKAWFEANIPPGAKVLMDGGRDFFTVSPPLRYSRAGVERRIQEARRDEPGKVRYWETLLQTTGNGGYDLYPIQGDMFHRTAPQLREEGFQYVVLSSDILNSIVTGRAYQWDPQADVLYRSLQQDARLLKLFVPGPLQPGPALWVYDVP